MRPLFLQLSVLTAALALEACGAAPPPVHAAAAAPASAQTAPAPEPAASTTPLPDHALPRSAVREVVSQGLGAFLQHVELEDQPVLVGGKFHGFRIAQLRGSQFWNGVDLKPGDVIAGVNGFPIERPEQAQTAFESLQVASELRVAYERDGQPRELAYAIVDDR